MRHRALRRFALVFAVVAVVGMSTEAFAGRGGRGHRGGGSHRAHVVRSHNYHYGHRQHAGYRNFSFYVGGPAAFYSSPYVAPGYSYYYAAPRVHYAVPHYHHRAPSGFFYSGRRMSISVEF